MIETKKDLNFYIAADRMIRGLNPKLSIRDCVLRLLGAYSFCSGGHILEYQRQMRYCSFLKGKKGLDKILYIIHLQKFSKLGRQLGFSIGYDCFGYGLLIPHYGTIVVHEGVRAGNYCVLHTSTCIGGGNKIFGDGLYLSTGAKIVGEGNLGNGITVAGNSYVNCSKVGEVKNVLLTGIPATIKLDNYPVWYVKEGGSIERRIDKIEKYKNKFYGKKME